MDDIKINISAIIDDDFKEELRNLVREVIKEELKKIPINYNYTINNTPISPTILEKSNYPYPTITCGTNKSGD